MRIYNSTGGLFGALDNIADLASFALSLFRNLQIQNLDREHNSLAVFLHEATLALKDEIRQLPIDLRQQIPPFESVFAWAEDKQLREGPLCGAIDGVLLIMAQLASYIGYDFQALK